MNPKTKKDSKSEKLQQELEEMTELAKRTMADMQNQKRRFDEEKNLLITMGNINLIRSLLPIIDNLNRAKEHAPENTDAEWLKGIEMSIDQLNTTLTNFGLKEIPTKGEKFNPDLYEAVLQDEGEKDLILEELEKGYILGERVIRHAKVKVGS